MYSIKKAALSVAAICACALAAQTAYADGLGGLASSLIDNIQGFSDQFFAFLGGLF